MIQYNHILAVIEADRDTQPALNRAVELARKTGASVTAILIIYDFSYDMTTMLSGDERESMRQAVIQDKEKWLEDEVRTLTDFTVDVVVKWNNRAYEEVIRYTISSKADMVVKATKKHDDLSSVIFTPTDWHLLRKCPTPVLLVKDHGWPEQGNIIAAVNVGTEDEEHARLNSKLTSVAKQYAELLSGHVHLVNAYPGTPLNVAIEVPDFDPSSYNNAVKTHHIEEILPLTTHVLLLKNGAVFSKGTKNKMLTGPQLSNAFDCHIGLRKKSGRYWITESRPSNPRNFKKRPN